MTRAVRIGNISGFYGDRLNAAREVLDGGPVDVLCGDYRTDAPAIPYDLSFRI